MVKFGEVVKNVNLVDRDPETTGIERIVGLDHIDPDNLHIRRWNSIEEGTSFTRRFVPGQTLFGKRRAYQRKVAYAEFEGICSGDILTFEPKDKKVLLPELLPFICQSSVFFDHALGTSAGSLSPRTNWTALKNFEFPLFPLDEQKRIAEILWAADEVAERTVEQLDRLRDLKKHLMQELLTKGIGHTEFKDSSLGRIPVGWEVVALSDMADIDPASLANSTPPDYAFHYIDIASVSTGKIAFPTHTITFAASPSRARRRIQSGDVLMSTVRPNRKAFAYFPGGSGDFVCSTGFAVLRTKEGNSSHFLFNSILSDDVSKQIEGLVTGSNYPAIRSTDVKKLKLNKPPLSEQQQIAAVLTSADEITNKTEAKLDSVKTLKQRLIQHLLSGEVREEISEAI